MAKSTTRRQELAEVTRNIIFDTAIELFKTEGFENVTIEQITQKSGVAKGTFYSHFATKSDIVVEEFEQIDSYYRKYKRNLSRYDSAEDKIRAFTRVQLRHVRDVVGVSLLKILYINNLERVGGENTLINEQRYLHVLVAEIIEIGQKQGDFKQDVAASELAYLWNRGMRSMFLDWCIADGEFNLVSDGMEYFENLLLPGIKKGF